MTTLYDSYSRNYAYLSMVRDYIGGVVVQFEAWSGVFVITNEWSSNKIKYAKQRKIFVE